MIVRRVMNVAALTSGKARLARVKIIRRSLINREWEELKAYLGDRESQRQLGQTSAEVAGLNLWVLGLERWGSIICIRAAYEAAVYADRVLGQAQALPEEFAAANSKLLTAIGQWLHHHQNPVARQMLAKYQALFESRATVVPPNGFDVDVSYHATMATLYLFAAIGPSTHAEVTPPNQAALFASACVMYCVRAVEGKPLPDGTPSMLDHIRGEILRTINNHKGHISIGINP